MPVVGGNTLRCASAFNAADPGKTKSLPMTDTLKDAVVKAINEKPANEEHKKLMADVKAEYEAYLKSGSKTLFDCPGMACLTDSIQRRRQSRPHSSDPHLCQQCLRHIALDAVQRLSGNG